MNNEQSLERFLIEQAKESKNKEELELIVRGHQECLDKLLIKLAQVKTEEDVYCPLGPLRYRGAKHLRKAIEIDRWRMTIDSQALAELQ